MLSNFHFIDLSPVSVTSLNLASLNYLAEDEYREDHEKVNEKDCPGRELSPETAKVVQRVHENIVRIDGASLVEEGLLVGVEPSAKCHVEKRGHA